MGQLLPSAKELIQEVLEEKPDIDINALHKYAYESMCRYIDTYYKKKVNKFLSQIKLSNELKKTLRAKMLKRVTVNEKKYSNFMEEAARRISQSIQPTSGKIAELCLVRELVNAGLAEGRDFRKGQGNRTDIIIYHPHIHSPKKQHWIEVKNISYRERGLTSFHLRGNSLAGFFTNEREFSPGNIKLIEKECIEKSGYLYVPKHLFDTLRKNKRLTQKTRFRPITAFGKDMVTFNRKGKFI